MYIDAPIYPSHYRWLFDLLFVLSVLVLAAFAKLLWWQYVVLALGAGVCLVWRKKPMPNTLSAKQPDELWQLGVDDELWQGYLNQAELIDVGITKALKLTFYLSEPYQQSYTLLIFRPMLSETDFRKLTTLVRVGGYGASD